MVSGTVLAAGTEGVPDAAEDIGGKCWLVQVSGAPQRRTARWSPGGPVKTTVRKVSGSEIQVSICGDIRISGDLARFLAPDPGPEPGDTGAEPGGRSC